MEAHRIMPVSETSVSPLTESVERALCESGYCVLRRLHVVERGSGIVIEGVVSTYYLKQLVQAVAMRVAGGTAVQNDVEVRSSGLTR
jgi:hypothetical protein